METSRNEICRKKAIVVTLKRKLCNIDFTCAITALKAARAINAKQSCCEAKVPVETSHQEDDMKVRKYLPVLLLVNKN